MSLNDAERALRRKTHETIKRVTLDLDPRVHLNTAVSALMELVNELYAFCPQDGLRIGAAAGQATGDVERPATIAVLKEAIEALVLMLSPFTPHMAEELWEQLGHAGGIVAAGWPAFDETVAKPDEIVVPGAGQRQGARAPDGAGRHIGGRLRELALADPAVRAHSRARP